MVICLVDSFIYSIQYHESVVKQVIPNGKKKRFQFFGVLIHTRRTMSQVNVLKCSATVLVVPRFHFSVPIATTHMHAYTFVCREWEREREIEKIEQNGINFMEMSEIKERYQMKREQSETKTKFSIRIFNSIKGKSAVGSVSLPKKVHDRTRSSERRVELEEKTL